MFHHGWPLSSDDWDAQMMYLVGRGFRVIAHDRRGHGRSSQVSDSHDMDHHAADVAAVVEHLDLRNAVHIGHSIGGGEATDQIMPIANSALLPVKRLKNGVLKVYEKFPHGMCTTHSDVVNPELLAFIKG